MSRAYRQKPDDVVARRIGMAAAPASKPSDAETWSRLATLPPGETSDDERTEARWSVARQAMTLAHGHVLLREHACPDRRCRERGHGADLDARDELLAVLGLNGGEQR